MLKKFLAACLMAGVVVAAAPIAHASEGPDPKVLVCKYVGKPGVAERLKDGKNPIEVSANSLPGYTGGTPQPGDEFADAQERSLVVAEGTEVCPAPVVRFRITIRMTGEGRIRDTLSAPADSAVSGSATATCGKKTTGSFDLSIGTADLSYGPFTSKKGPVLRVVSKGIVLLKLRASDNC